MMLQFFSLFGMLVALVHIAKSMNNYRGNVYLGIFFLLSSFWGLVTHQMFFTSDPGLINWILLFASPLVFLSAPFLYFYIRSVVNDDPDLYKKDLIHLITPVIVLFFTTHFIFTDKSDWMSYLDGIRQNHSLLNGDIKFLMPHVLGMILRPLYYIFYLRLCANIISGHEQKVRENKVHKENYYRYFSVWINLTMSALSLVIGMFIFLDLVDFFVLHANRLMYLQMVEVIIVVVFMILNVSFLFIPSMMFGLPQIPHKTIPTVNLNTSKENVELTMEIDQAPEPGMLSQEYMKNIQGQIDEYLLDKPYIQQNFSKVNLAAGANIPMHHLSFYFNQVVEKSFAEWRNELRIEYSIEMIKEGKAKFLTLDTIARESGFSNQTTFISSFKKYTGTTPNNFIRGSKWE